MGRGRGDRDSHEEEEILVKDGMMGWGGVRMGVGGVPRWNLWAQERRHLGMDKMRVAGQRGRGAAVESRSLGDLV